MNTHWRNILRRPVVTEKSNYQIDFYNQYTFVVDDSANKIQIKQAVEMAWPDVTVEKVRIANMPAKRGRRGRHIAIRKAGWKKATVTLEANDSIDLFEGV